MRLTNTELTLILNALDEQAESTDLGFLEPSHTLLRQSIELHLEYEPDESGELGSLRAETYLNTQLNHNTMKIELTIAELLIIHQDLKDGKERSSYLGGYINDQRDKAIATTEADIIASDNQLAQLAKEDVEKRKKRRQGADSSKE